ATLDGRMSSPLHDLVSSIAEATTGVRAITCRIQDRRSLEPARPHVHTSRGAVPTRVDHLP
ncbi:MAG TPA: hypothetical protein VFQ40_01665, partial [Actinomycetota bacterium]|nr:hypothetical protein [Actinomycetota bacterium]